MEITPKTEVVSEPEARKSVNYKDKHSSKKAKRFVEKQMHNIPTVSCPD